MVKRQAVTSIEAQKHQMIAALYANSAFEENGEKGVQARSERIKELERYFVKAIEIVYHPELHKEKEIDWNNPFWAAAKRSYDRKLERLRGENPDVKTVGEVIDKEDQEKITARSQARAELLRENS